MPTPPEERKPPVARDPGQASGASGQASGAPGQPSPSPPSSAEEALRRLEQRLGRATEAAERLMAEAAAEAAGAGNPGEGAGNPGEGADDAPATDPPGGPDDPGDPTDHVKPPPAGWQIPEDTQPGIPPELDPFITLLQAVRDLIPPELQRRLVAALRELLLALRALIDWYLERLERGREQSAEVEDIPIL